LYLSREPVAACQRAWSVLLLWSACLSQVLN
jgi:hypothetical protein